MVCPELLRGAMEDTASRLTSCYNSVWETKRWPKLWKKEVVKKGSLSAYNNLRVVTLLPVTSKIFCRMLLERIKKGVDKKFESSRLSLDPRKIQLNKSLYLKHLTAGKCVEGGYVWALCRL